jgi:hypothetical protein
MPRTESRTCDRATALHCRHPNRQLMNSAIREAGIGVEHGRIVDVSGKRPGFTAGPSLRNGLVNRTATLAKVIRERGAEIVRRRAVT